VLRTRTPSLPQRHAGTPHQNSRPNSNVKVCKPTGGPTTEPPLLFHDTPTFNLNQQFECAAVKMASSETAGPCEANGTEETPTSNGTNGAPQTPTQTTPAHSEGPLARTPSLSSFALTEYSAKPTPPTEDRKTHMKKIVPDEFLLPNGNPDVSHPTLLPPSASTVGRAVTDTSHSTCVSSSPRTPGSERCATRFRSFTPSI
jgi:hypothetical protein